MTTCRHTPDFEQATIHADDEGRLVVDVPCAKCGCSGSFDATPNLNDINW